MYLPEEGFHMRVTFIPIVLLAQANSRTEILSLLPSRRFRFMEKVVEKGTALEPNPYSIAVRDEDDNIFLFRRRSANSYIMGERGLLSELDELRDGQEKDIQHRTRRLTKALFENIRKWVVTREEIEPLFPIRHAPDNLTNIEQRLIRTIRERNLDTEQVLNNLDRLT
ncbi:MAG TPA: hypothetical protein DD713_03410 [Nitrospiraceae bacterium]|nr:hypothetical protein [Nitrospiraceae bacterium]